jgi:hypothetical protein
VVNILVYVKKSKGAWEYLGIQTLKLGPRTNDPFHLLSPQGTEMTGLKIKVARLSWRQAVPKTREERMAQKKARECPKLPVAFHSLAMGQAAGLLPRQLLSSHTKNSSLCNISVFRNTKIAYTW